MKALAGLIALGAAAWFLEPFVTWQVHGTLEQRAIDGWLTEPPEGEQ